MGECIKINGGSFDLTAVLSYKTEDAFVEYFNKAFPGWLTEEKRKATLREIYRIADKTRTNGDVKSGVRSNKKTRRSPNREKDDRGDERHIDRSESGTDDARD